MVCYIWYVDGENGFQGFLAAARNDMILDVGEACLVWNLVWWLWPPIGVAAAFAGQQLARAADVDIDDVEKGAALIRVCK